MAINFHKIPRPWPQDICRRRYVEGGDDISFRKLATESGRAKSTILVWAKELIDGLNWEQQRSRFKSTISAATHEKTVQKTSEKLSDELSDVAIANYSVHKLIRDYAHAVIQIKVRHLKQVQGMTGEEQLAELKKHSASDMNYWSLIAARATQEIAAATGLPYHVNLNTSAKRLEQEGYVILDPRQEEGESAND